MSGVCGGHEILMGSKYQLGKKGNVGNVELMYRTIYSRMIGRDLAEQVQNEFNVRWKFHQTQAKADQRKQKVVTNNALSL